MKLKNKVDNLSTQAVNRFDSNLKKEKATSYPHGFGVCM
jgi:hypothetical protein